MVFEWKKEYSVNVKEIDDQHKRFIGLLDRLYKSILNNTVQAELAVILKELLEYAHLHFDTEEKYFDKFHYENAVEHKTEHRRLLGEIEDFAKRHASREVDISFELIDFLEDWLVCHLAMQDHKYVKCFNEHGLF